MTANLTPFERFVRFFLAAAAFLAAALLYEHLAAKIIVFLLGLGALGEGLFATCPLMKRLGVRSPKDRLSTEALALLGLQAIQAVIAYEWWHAGWEKVTSGDFVAGIGKTLAFFASKNPWAWCQEFLLGFATENAAILGQLVQWGELAVGVALAISIGVTLYAKSSSSIVSALRLSVVALIGGMVLNAVFYFCAGWTSPSTQGVNMIMFWVQAILLYVQISTLIRMSK